MSFIAKFVCCLALVLALDGACALATTSRAESSFSEYALQRMQVHGVVGASIAVIENRKLSDTLNLGFESAHTETPVNNNSVFQVGSISKPISAWAAMTLVRDGVLDLDEPVGQYLTRWRIPESKFNADKVTLRRLLSHTAGLRLHGYTGFPENESLPSLEDSLSGQTRGSGKVELFQEPGGKFSYSGGAYTLIQLLIEETSGLSFNDYVQMAVFQPLGMRSSSYAPKADLLQRRVDPHGYSRNPIGQYHFRAQAAASLHTTSTDLARFVVANVSSNDVLENAFISTMHAPFADAGFADIGLGFFSNAKAKLVGHGGANLGWRASMWFSPNTGNGLIVMTNSDGAGTFLRELKCFWDAGQENPLIEKDCQLAADSIARSESLAKWLVRTIVALVLIVVGALAWFLLTARVVLALPRTKPKLITLLLLLTVVIFTLVFLYTPFGVYLHSGFKSIFATIHYAPPGVALVVPWACVLLIVLGCLIFVERTIKKERE